MAQQTPLTGRMLGGHHPAAQATTAKPAPPPAQPPAEQVARQPATTYPTAPAQQARRTTAPPQAPAQPAQQQMAAAPAPSPMPAYTDLRTPLATLPPAMNTPPPPAFGSPMGTVTHSLLRMQASNSHAVATLPTLGDEATAAYQRYIQSFNHPIPEFFQTMVESSSQSGSGMQ